MACAVFRRHTRGRRFLLDEEVQQLAESEDNPRKRLISALPVDDEMKGHLYKAQSAGEVFENLRRFGTGVCRVEVGARGYNYTGSGFHFGSGWILTSSHVLRNREMLNNARFVFVSPDFGGEVVFEAKPRRAIAHRLLPAGRRTDYHNRDVTLTKLGIQFNRRNGEQLEEWEVQEQQLLEKFDPFDFSSLAEKSFSPEGNIRLGQRASDRFTVIHFGGSTGVKQFAIHLVAHEVWKFINLRLVNFTTPIEPSASGSPVLLFKNGEWLLVGVFVGGALYGTPARNVGAGQALVWNQEAMKNIDAGRDAVNRMESFKSYSVFVPFQERQQLLNDKSVKEAAQLALKHRILIV